MAYYSQDVNIDVDETPFIRDASPKKPNPSTTKVYDVIVVGAGISGLYAAKCLREEGLDILVLEATEKVGGRIFTVQDAQHGSIDMGGSHIGRLQSKVMSLVRELGLELYRQPSQGNNVFFYKGERYRYSPGTYPSENPLVAMDLNNAMRSLDKISLQVPTEEPWACKKAEEWDNTNVQEFLYRLCWFEISSTYLGVRLGQVFHCKLEEVSLLYCLHYIRSCGGCQALLGDMNNIQEMKVKGGAGQLCDRLATKLSEVILYETLVTAVHQGAQGVVVKTENNNDFKCQHVIFAAAPCVLKSITFYPSLPDNLKDYTNIKPQSHRIRSTLLYDKPFWRNEGCRGLIISDDGIAAMAMDNSGPDSKPLAISSMVDGLEYAGLTREDRKLQLAGQYSSIFESPEMRVCSAYKEKDWADLVARRRYGPPVFTLPPGVLTKCKCIWGTSFERVHFAGTDAALRFRGCIEGALRAGEAVTRKVLGAMKIPEKRCYEEEDSDVKYAKKTLSQCLLPSVPQFLVILGFIVLALVVLIVVVSVVKKAEDHISPTPATDWTTAVYDITNSTLAANQNDTMSSYNNSSSS